MFDFFKDTYYDLKGFNRKKMELEKLQSANMKEKVFLSKSSKALIYAISVIMLLTCVVTSLQYFSNSQLAKAIINVIGLPMLICVIVLASIRKKKTEIGSIIVFIIFFIYRYITLQFV